jgi:hypothetical protein
MSQLLVGLAFLAMGASSSEAPAPPRRVHLALGTAKNSSSTCLSELAAVFKAEVRRRKGLALARSRAESDVAVEVATCRTRTSADVHGSADAGGTFGTGDRTTWVRGELSGGVLSYTSARLTVERDDGKPPLEFTSGSEPRSTDEALAAVVAAALDGLESLR